MGEQTPRIALLRLSGEIGIKGRATRMQFRKRLVQNLRDALTSSGLPRSGNGTSIRSKSRGTTVSANTARASRSMSPLVKLKRSGGLPS